MQRLTSPSSVPAFRPSLPARAVRPRLRGWWTEILFIGAHIPLSLLMKAAAPVSQAHALATVVLGLIWALPGRKLERVALVGAYIASAEVLWRMTGGVLFWEYGKYALSLVFLVALIRARRLRGPLSIGLYFLLLLPSVALTLSALGPFGARREISFNLSGPFALTVCAWFFWNVRLSRRRLLQLLLAIIAPLVGVSSIATSYLLDPVYREFEYAFNPALAGGFGPNQVSAVLGLAALSAFLCTLHPGFSRMVRVLMFIVMIALCAQSALTLSRGGLYMFAGSALVAAFFLFRRKRTAIRVLVVISACLLLAGYFIFPRLETFTGGALSTRFADTRMTGREEGAAADWKLFKQNPLFGVGPGIGLQYREIGAHTEFTRLLAEHGLLGLLAQVILLVAGIRNSLRASPELRPLTASLTAWSFLFLAINGMRLAASAFCFGIGYVMLAQARKRPTKGRRRPSHRQGLPPARIKAVTERNAAPA